MSLNLCWFPINCVGENMRAPLWSMGFFWGRTTTVNSSPWKILCELNEVHFRVQFNIGSQWSVARETVPIKQSAELNRWRINVVCCTCTHIFKGSFTYNVCKGICGCDWSHWCSALLDMNSRSVVAILAMYQKPSCKSLKRSSLSLFPQGHFIFFYFITEALYFVFSCRF